MNIQIMSRPEVMRYCLMPHEERSIIVSINNIPTECFPFIRCCHKSSDNGVQDILTLFFNDEDKIEHFCMVLEHARQIVKFLSKNTDKFDTLIVHCQGGVSRSAGVAGALMKFFNGDDSPAFSGIRIPNMVCYRTMMNALIETTNNKIEEESK